MKTVMVGVRLTPEAVEAIKSKSAAFKNGYAGGVGGWLRDVAYRELGMEPPVVHQDHVSIRKIRKLKLTTEELDAVLAGRKTRP